jgi:hypothetical protein
LVAATTTVTFTAASGDELYGSLEGDFWMNVNTGYGEGMFYGPFTGGTGRFEAAQGTVVKEWIGQQRPSDAVLVSSWEGVVGY